MRRVLSQTVLSRCKQTLKSAKVGESARGIGWASQSGLKMKYIACQSGKSLTGSQEGSSASPKLRANNQIT